MSDSPHSEAEKIAREIVSKHSGHHMQSTISWVDRPQLVTAITSALISAEQRGAQREDWQPIESAPRDGTWFWAFYPKKSPECFQDQWKPARWVEDWFSEGFPAFIDYAEHEEFDQPTHWRRLPPPPGGAE